MSIVRFATTCDQCVQERRSAEYTSFPECRECGMDICPDHEMSNERNNETNKTLCRDCGGMVIE